MLNIVRLTEAQILTLAEVLTDADNRGASVRIRTYTDLDGQAHIQWDNGSGWTWPEKGEDW